MMGEIYFTNKGVDWRSLIAIHLGMSIRLHGLKEQDAHLVLYAVEHNLIRLLIHDYNRSISGKVLG